YLVLEDEESRLAFETVHRDLSEVIGNLLSLTEDPALIAALRQFALEEDGVYQHVSNMSFEPMAKVEKVNGRRSASTREQRDRPRKERVEATDEMFSTLNQKSRELARAFSGIVDSEVDNLEHRSDVVQRRMLQESSVLLP